MIGSIVVFVIFLLIIAGVFYFIYQYARKKNNSYRMLTPGTMFACPNTCYCPPPKKDQREKQANKLGDPVTMSTDCEQCKNIDENFCFNCDLIEGGVVAESLDACKQACDTTYQCDAIRYDADSNECRLLYIDPTKMPGTTVKAPSSNVQFGWKIRPTGKDGGESTMAAPLFSGETYSQKCMPSS